MAYQIFVHAKQKDDAALVDTLAQLLDHVENEIVEFKAASSHFDLHKLGQYFSAISNEANLRDKRFGWLVFGVDDKTHKILGTQYKNSPSALEKLKLEIAQNTTDGITFMNIFPLLVDEDGPKRVLMFQIPAAALSMPTGWKNRYYGRSGESLVDLSQEKIDRIRNQPLKDWSKELFPDSSEDWLDLQAVATARANYRDRLASANNPGAVADLDRMSDIQFLSKLKLVKNGRLTRAALLLLGKEEFDDAFDFPPQIMWRLYDSKGNTLDHQTFQIPFLFAVDAVYAKLRNLTYRYLPNQLSLFPKETPQYDAWLLRELINNAIAHQDYPLGTRIYVNEFEDHITVINGGQFIPGAIKPVLEPAYAPPYYRNPLLAQAMTLFKMIDTAALGIRRVYTIQREKLFPMPDYDLSHVRQVQVKVYGKILDENYTKILFENPEMDLETVYLLDCVQKGKRLERGEVAQLRKQGLIEGRSPHLFVSASIAETLGQKAQYIKNKGFDDQYYKKLILDYLKIWGKGKRSDFNHLLLDKLPDSLSDSQKKNKIRNLLASLRAAELIETDSPNHQISHWVLTKRGKEK